MSNPAAAAAAPPATMAVARTAQNSVLVRMAERLGIEPKVLEGIVKQTLMPNGKNDPPATNEEIAAFLIVADRYQLDPILKQIYAFRGQNGNIVPIVPIDGWITIVNRHAKYRGVEQFDQIEEGELIAVRTSFHVDGLVAPVTVTEYMAECKRNTSPWGQWPARMLRHKSYIQGARYAFGISGIYDPDEGERLIEATAVVSKPAPGQSRVAQLEATLAEPEPDAAAPAEGDLDEVRESGSDG